jgi:hypothetical protein
MERNDLIDLLQQHTECPVDGTYACLIKCMKQLELIKKHTPKVLLSKSDCAMCNRLLKLIKRDLRKSHIGDPVLPSVYGSQSFVAHFLLRIRQEQ